MDEHEKLVKTGDIKASFRGEPATILGGKPPHKPGSTGRVNTSAGEFFPSVYGLKWVKA